MVTEAMHRLIKHAVAATAVFFWLLPASAQQVQEQPDLSKPHITVADSASEDVRPDFAEFVINLQEQRSSSVEALAAMAKSTNELVVDIQGQGIKFDDIKTTQVSFRPTFDEEHDARGQVTKHTQTGYSALNSITIKIRDINKVSTIVSAAIEHAKSGWQSLNFFVSDRDVRTDVLFAKAVENAKQRATLSAASAQMKLGRALLIDTRSSNYADQGFQVQSGRANLYRDSDPLAILPGLQHISATVTATWELLPQ